MPKKNLLKVPTGILEKIQKFDQDDVVVACAKLLAPADVARYSHLGIELVNNELTLPAPALPQVESGKYSRANIEGYEKIRKDLPKIEKSFEIESPNWGDSSNGTHTVSWSRLVYQRDFYPPKEVELSVTLIEKRATGWIVRFAIDQVINRRTPNFEQALLYNLNLLQENVGAADAFPSATSLADYANTVRVDWQIFPAGTVDEVVRNILATRRKATAVQESTIKQRVTVMSRLKPEAYIAGTDGFLRYFGAKFGDDFVVFENANYGNALYVMYENWEELSKRSRVELLSGPRESFDRIEHRSGWEGVLKHKIEEYRSR